MNKQNVIAYVLILITFSLSCFVIISKEKEMNDMSRQVYELKQEQTEVANKINVLFDNYSSINNALSFYESDTDMNMSQIREALVVLDELSANDSMLIGRLEVIYDKQIEQGIELSEVREEYSATGGFGVLTGEVAIGNTEVIAEPIEILPEPEPEPIEEPVVFSCPSPDRSVDFGRYISKISFNRDVRFTIDFDIQDGQITNQVFSKKINTKLKKAVAKYLSDSLDTTNNASNCSLPFAIEV
tara:strand:- start:1220 stop:1948 length:729 start_codon:yes stop_codon:yes gene_type:complete